MKRVFQFLLVALATGCASTSPPQTLRFHEQVSGDLSAAQVRLVTVPSTGQRLAIAPDATLTERDVFEAKLQPTVAGAAVLVKFDAHGANLLAEMTTRLRSRSVVVFVNDRPVAAVLVEHANATGQFLLLGDFTDAEAQSLVDSLNKTAGRPRDLGDTKLVP